MLSKCANPECFEQFRYLHQGKLFLLTPSPELPAASTGVSHLWDERFWLCDRCCKEMIIVWDGMNAKVERIHTRSGTASSRTNVTRKQQRAGAGR
jgi:hypothetical protein